jgi:hypothetical protein
LHQRVDALVDGTVGHTVLAVTGASDTADGRCSSTDDGPSVPENKGRQVFDSTESTFRYSAGRSKRALAC